MKLVYEKRYLISPNTDDRQESFFRAEVRVNYRIVLEVINCVSIKSHGQLSNLLFLRIRCLFTFLFSAVVTCDIPAFPTNINSSCGENSLISYGTQCLFGCEPGYELQGESTLTCLASGSLSSDLPTCEGMCTNVISRI